MMTRINLFDHSSGLRDTIELSTPRDVLIERLREALGEPHFETIDPDVSIYARVDSDPIVIHLFGFGKERVAAAWNEVLGTLTRRVIA